MPSERTTADAVQFLPLTTVASRSRNKGHPQAPLGSRNEDPTEKVQNTKYGLCKDCRTDIDMLASISGAVVLWFYPESTPAAETCLGGTDRVNKDRQVEDG
jgi:hypothetical protein